MNQQLKPIIIFTGPSGVGKGTIEKILFANKNLNLKLSCSATTRKAREGEKHGVNYFFISKDDFQKHIDNNELLEYSFHFENFYGTLHSEIERIHKENKIPFLEIETFGAKQILSDENNLNKYKIITFFVSPPSFEDLEARILNRNTETKEAITKRLAKAHQEMEERHNFKYQIINDVPEIAAKQVEEIIIKEIGA
ncbi:guanylate kinase [Mycoplasmopsis columbina]|uniref:guanylate kinase n=1 Tax=Mycoplasmopsis columbina TaxID=114881 RepID=UPI0004A720D5|nr:guanylate kinase [Mycoplasmopsis columbina]VEU77145.1 guanylate kinase [Mycoplasmopsis columbina]